MPVRVNGKTIVDQEQVQKSDSINDNLPLLTYDSLETLQEDLNYIRSILKDLKGTDHYDSPVTNTLENIQGELETAVFNDVTLTGNSTSDNPPLSDSSQRIATTEYVTEKISERLTQSRYVHIQGVASEIWSINHNLNRPPSVTVVDSAGQVVLGNVIYIDNNNISVQFSAGFSGKAYLN